MSKKSKYVALRERKVLLERVYKLIDAGVVVHDPQRLDIRGTLACGKNVEIDINVIIEGEVVLEDGVYIGAQCNIGSCHIKENALIASGVHIMSGKNQHNFDDIETPIQQQGGVFEQVIIGEDSWVGNGALIMANVGRKCIVGAGSVVTKDVPDYSVVVGNPAKVVKSRLVEE